MVANTTLASPAVVAANVIDHAAAHYANDEGGGGTYATAILVIVSLDFLTFTLTSTLSLTLILNLNPPPGHSLTRLDGALSRPSGPSPSWQGEGSCAR